MIKQALIDRFFGAAVLLSATLIFWPILFAGEPTADIDRQELQFAAFNGRSVFQKTHTGPISIQPGLKGELLHGVAIEAQTDALQSQALIQELQSLGLPAYSIKEGLAKGNIVIGPFGSESEAEVASDTIKRHWPELSLLALSDLLVKETKRS